MFYFFPVLEFDTSYKAGSPRGCFALPPSSSSTQRQAMLCRGPSPTYTVGPQKDSHAVGVPSRSRIRHKAHQTPVFTESREEKLKWLLCDSDLVGVTLRRKREGLC